MSSSGKIGDGGSTPIRRTDTTTFEPDPAVEQSQADSPDADSGPAPATPEEAKQRRLEGQMRDLAVRAGFGTPMTSEELDQAVADSRAERLAYLGAGGVADRSGAAAAPAQPKKKDALTVTGEAIKTGKSYDGYVKDVTGFAAQGIRSLSGPEVKQLDELAARTGQYQDALHSIDSRMQELTNGVKSGAFTRREVIEEVYSLKARSGAVMDDLQKAEQESAKLLGKLSPSERRGRAFTQFTDKMDGARKYAEKGLVGLDILGNFAELQSKDPGDWMFNLSKATTATLSKMGVDKILEKNFGRLNAAQAAVGVMQFGLQCVGLKDSAVDKTLTAVSQGFPGDAVMKGLYQAFDQGKAVTSLLRTGSMKELEELNAKNLKGDNGLVVQGAAIMGDLMATGGKNIPAGDALGLAESLGVFNQTQMPKEMRGASTDKKVAFLESLMHGQYTNQHDGLLIRDLLKATTPAQLNEIMNRVDHEKLAASLRHQGTDAINPVADLIIDMANKTAALPEDSLTRKHLNVKIGNMVAATVSNGHWQALDHLRDHLGHGGLSELPAPIQGRIRSGR